MKKSLIKFAPLIGGALIILSGFLPWGTGVPGRGALRGAPFLLKDPYIFERLTVFGTAFLGIAAVILGFNMILTTGTLHTIFSVFTFLVGIFAFLSYSLWWLWMSGPTGFYIPPGEPTIDIGAVHIGVYVGLLGSLIILAGLFLSMINFLRISKRWLKAILVLFFLLAIIASGVTYKTLVLNKPPLTPEQVAEKFTQAIQAKNRKQAQTFLSINANREAFKATLEESTETPSLYDVDFSFSIKHVRLAEEENKVFVDIEIKTKTSVIEEKMTLVKEGSWLKGYYWRVFDLYGISESPEIIEAFRERGVGNAIIYLSGPAHLYITDPQGKHSGFDPVTQKEINEIEGVFYNTKSLLVQEYAAIWGMAGVWNVKVVGIGSGKYFLATENPIRENPQFKELEGTIDSGEIKEYRAVYPTPANQPIELYLVSE